MKKLGLALLFVALATVIGVGAGYYFFVTQHQQTASSAEAITAQAAEDIALKDAGLTKAEVGGLNSHMERDDGRKYYDVQFTVKGEDGSSTLYEYEIDTQSGAVLSREQEGTINASAQSTTPQTSGEISADEAKQIALNHAGVNEADTYYVDVDYEREEHGNEWSVDFETATTEYDYSISATDGSILEAANEQRH